MLKNTLISRFLHPDLRQVSHPAYGKAVVVAWAVVTILVFIIPYDIYFWIAHPEDIVKNITNGIGLILFMTNLGLMRWSKNIKHNLAFLTITSLGPTMYSTYTTGGIYSSDIGWLMVTMLGTFVFVDVFYGIIVALLVSTYLSILYYQDIINPTSHFKEYLLAHTSTHSIFTWLFVIILISVLMTLFIQKLNEANKKVDNLSKQKIEDLEILIKQKTSEISQIRANLAKDFHDEMGNKLASITILSQEVGLKMSNGYNPTEIGQMLDTIEKRSLELYQGTKDFIWSVDFKSDYYFELFMYLRDFGEIFFSKIDISFYSFSTLNENSLLKSDATVGRQIVFIVKELMTNAAKHAQCDEVSFKLIPKDGFIIVVLSDNGKGFNTQLPIYRGLSNIEKRVASIHGQMEISSEPENGTIFRIKVPSISQEHLPFSGSTN